LFKDNFSIIEVDSVDSKNIYEYVSKRISDNKFKIDSFNIEYFLSKVGNDINNINNELEKLFVYKFEDKKILREDIDMLVFDNIDNVIYEFSNAILDEDYDKVKVMYDKFMLDNVSFEYLLSTVAGSFRTSLIVKLLNNKNMSNYEIGKIIGKKEYFVKKTLDRLYRYSVDDISSYINKLAMIDRDFKSGKDNVGRFELFLYLK
jgi:DNA polymerase-3 subunit delta